MAHRLNCPMRSILLGAIDYSIPLDKEIGRRTHYPDEDDYEQSQKYDDAVDLAELYALEEIVREAILER